MCTCSTVTIPMEQYEKLKKDSEALAVITGNPDKSVIIMPFFGPGYPVVVNAPDDLKAYRAELARQYDLNCESMRKWYERDSKTESEPVRRKKILGII